MMFACSVCPGSGCLAGKTGEFFVINEAAICEEPDETDCAAIGKGKLCGQLAAAVLVKICKVAAFQRILCAGKRDRETRSGEKLTAGGTVPQAYLLLGYGGKGFLFFPIQKKRPDVGRNSGCESCRTD